jgi:hypothetical protein
MSVSIISADQRLAERQTPAPTSKPRSYSSWEECATCFAHGIFGYRKETLARFGQLTPAASTEPGELVWFCCKHMPARFFADARRG